MPALPSSIDDLRRRLPLRTLLVATLAYYAVVTYQFAGYQPQLAEFPPGFGELIGIDPAASLLVQYLGYLAGAVVLSGGILTAVAERTTGTGTHAESTG